MATHEPNEMERNRLRRGETLFAKVVVELNSAFPGRSEETWKQICYALAVLEEKSP